MTELSARAEEALAERERIARDIGERDKQVQELTRQLARERAVCERLIREAAEREQATQELAEQLAREQSERERLQKTETAAPTPTPAQPPPAQPAARPAAAAAALGGSPRRRPGRSATCLSPRAIGSATRNPATTAAAHSDRGEHRRRHRNRNVPHGSVLNRRRTSGDYMTPMPAASTHYSRSCRSRSEVSP